MYMKTDGKDESILSDDEAFLSKEELEALKKQKNIKQEKKKLMIRNTIMKNIML